MHEKAGIKSPLLFKILLGVVIGIVVILGAIFAWLNRPEPIDIIASDTMFQNEPVLHTTPQASPERETSLITVYVSGHVKRPGVFEFEYGAHIWQAIEAAGGMTYYADQNAINLAQRMTDEQHIIVFGIDDNMPPSVANVGLSNGTGTGGLININTASISQLQTLSGIGEARARDIIAHRDARGGFATIYELMNVPGIGEGIFARIKDDITVD